MRLWFIIKKEFLAVKDNLPFHAIAVVAPIFFLVFWTTALKQEVTLPVQVSASMEESAFAAFLPTFATPSGVPYLAAQPQQSPTTRWNDIHVEQDIQWDHGRITGHITQTFAHIDNNITKNFKNRLTGAVTTYLNTRFLAGKGIMIREYPAYPQDVSWKQYFAVTLMLLGMLMSGMLFGALSFTDEWERETHRFLTLSPQSPLWVIGGKLSAGLCKCALASCVFYAVAWGIITGVFAEELQFQAAILLPTCMLVYVLMVSFGMLAGIVIKDTVLCFLCALLGSLFLWVLGGGFGTNAILAPWMIRVTQLNPVSYAMRLVTLAFFHGQVNYIMSFFWLSVAAGLALWLTIWQYDRCVYRVK